MERGERKMEQSTKKREAESSHKGKVTRQATKKEGFGLVYD